MKRQRKSFLNCRRLKPAQTAFDHLRQEWEQTANKLKKLAAIKDDYDNIVQKQAELDSLKAELMELEKMIAALPPLAEVQAAFDKLKSRTYGINR